jgi:hypothetical protein
MATIISPRWGFFLVTGKIPHAVPQRKKKFGENNMCGGIICVNLRNLREKIKLLFSVLPVLYVVN